MIFRKYQVKKKIMQLKISYIVRLKTFYVVTIRNDQTFFKF